MISKRFINFIILLKHNLFNNKDVAKMKIVLLQQYGEHNVFPHVNKFYWSNISVPLCNEKLYFLMSELLLDSLGIKSNVHDLKEINFQFLIFKIFLILNNKICVYY